MRTSVPLLLLSLMLLLAATSAGLAAEKKGGGRVAHPAEASGPFQQFGGIGSPRARVLEVLGLPSHVVSHDFWIYLDFRTESREPVDPAFDTLVIIFEQEKVSAMKLTDGRMVRAWIAQQQKRKPNVPAAKNAPPR